ncbi:MAG: anaerobic ribonucleoside-triphosphate reductase activating protein [Chitinivibrionales bacterium]|nr:anaerobic ribonucleoside-triphosphate reductase activating protein [Chitinivibrionales bacterium]MBD3357625.1 anaerobic ribonucleoside-triphosphate reductase activating protein [Chitinivibrionales bacterium]
MSQLRGRNGSVLADRWLLPSRTELEPRKEVGVQETQELHLGHSKSFRRGDGGSRSKGGQRVRSRLIGLAGCTKTSCIDFPGTVSTVLFFAGCNLRCPYCHNPHVLESGGELGGASEGVWRFLEKRRSLIDGVVLSGGEPTINPHLEKFATEIASLGYRIKLDTNGLTPEMIERVAPDYLALDVKTDPARYSTHLGASCSDIEAKLRRSVAIARAMGDRAEVRITVAPGIVDRAAVLVLGDMLKGIKTVFLQPMSRRARLLDPAFGNVPAVPDAEIRHYRDLLGGSVGKCIIRGEPVDASVHYASEREAKAA